MLSSFNGAQWDQNLIGLNTAHTDQLKKIHWSYSVPMGMLLQLMHFVDHFSYSSVTIAAWCGGEGSGGGDGSQQR